MREEDLIERLPSSSSSSSESSSDDEGQETVISKPLLLPQKRLLAATTSDDKKKDDNQAEVEYLYGQNFYQLRDQCLSQGHLFEDPEFPTENDLLRERSQRYIDDVEWMRPSEILRFEEPVLVSDRNEGFDIRTRYYMMTISGIAV